MTITLYLIFGLLEVLLAFGVFRLVRRDYLRHGRLTFLTTVLQVAIFALHGCFVSLAFRAEWWRLNSNHLSLALGILSAALGLVILAAAIGVFGFPRMIGREVNVLKQSGIYRWSRNPQLVGYGWSYWPICCWGDLGICGMRS